MRVNVWGQVELGGLDNIVGATAAITIMKPLLSFMLQSGLRAYCLRGEKVELGPAILVAPTPIPSMAPFQIAKPAGGSI